MKTIDIRKYLKKLAKVQSPLLIHGQETGQGVRPFLDPSKVNYDSSNQSFYSSNK